MRHRAALTGLLVLAGTLAGILPIAPAQAAACGWRRVPFPDVAGQLIVAPTSVDVLSNSDAWAVGVAIREGQPNQTINTPLTWHWNGTSWSRGPHAHLVGSNETLLGVAMVSHNNVWAVGIYHVSGLQGPVGADRTLVHHWNGTKWSVVKSPNVGTGNNRLAAVDAISASNVWAVGQYSDGAGSHTLIEHYNGTKWSVDSSPAVSPPEIFNDVARIPGTSRAWAVGTSDMNATHKTLVQRSSGTTWATVASANHGTDLSELESVAATSPSNAWAVGAYDDGTRKTLAERWNGTSWQVVSTPDAPGASRSDLTDVAAHSGTSAWAVGNKTVDGIDRVLAERWNGSSWKIQPFPTVGVNDNSATDVGAIPGRNSAWAGGIYSDNDRFHPFMARYC